MSQSREITTRLFPLANDHIVVGALLTFDPEEKFNCSLSVSLEETTSSTSTSTKRQGWRKETDTRTNFRQYKESRSSGHECNIIPTVLPSGYYFSKSTIINGGTQEVTHAISLRNIVSHAIGSDTLDEDLDPNMIAAMSHTHAKLQLLGVGTDKRSIYLYTLEPQFSLVQTSGIMGSTFTPSNDFGLKRNYAEHTKTGTLLQTLPSNSGELYSIAGVTAAGKQYVVTATNNGELCATQLFDDKLVLPGMSLLNKSDRATPLQLFATSSGELIAYSSVDKWLYVFDMHTLGCTRHNCPELFNLSLSADGKYLTGLEKQEGAASNKVFCLATNPIAIHTITLDHAVEDFVIGKGGRVCTPKASAERSANFNIHEMANTYINYGEPITKYLPKAVLAVKAPRTVASATDFLHTLFHKKKKADAAGETALVVGNSTKLDVDNGVKPTVSASVKPN